MKLASSSACTKRKYPARAFQSTRAPSTSVEWVHSPVGAAQPAASVALIAAAAGLTVPFASTTPVWNRSRSLSSSHMKTWSAATCGSHMRLLVMAAM